MELLAVFPPLMAFLLAGLFSKSLGDKGAQFVTCTGVIIAAFASCVLFFSVIFGDAPRTITLAEWISVGEFSADWALRVDQLAVVMMVVINIVSACVHVYSIGYMERDPHKARFMAYLSLFTFAMLMLVTADNLVQLFFGWEGVGLASYLLIGFWNEKHSANAAAMKAFIVNRVGDLGLALGVMATFAVFGTVAFDSIFANAADYAELTYSFFGAEIHALTLICLLLFMGAVGKSAQLGLHTWLPDAMEGPTPVSALIHAATMVTAGVFLVARFSPVFEYAPTALMVVTVFGGLTAFVAATIGMTQWDIKRVIAYSTMSQLGYMFFALGVSAYAAAMFHLVTHAFFKALLFLGAGSVIHAMSNEQDMRKMGGIWKMIPTTYVLMWIGSLALAGIPFFAGFYSKDIMLEAAWADHTWFGNMAFWLGIAAAFMTAFYSWRLLILTFHGETRADDKVISHIHESPAVMIGPLVVLATGSLFAGAILYNGFVGSAHHEVAGHESAAVSHETGHEVEAHAELQTEAHDPELYGQDLAQRVADVVANNVEQEEQVWTREYVWGDSLFVLPENDTVEAAHNVPLWVKFLPVLMGGLGIMAAYFIYMLKAGLSGMIAGMFKPLYRLFFNKWYFDELYNAIFVKGAWRLGVMFSEKGDRGTVDRFGPDGLSTLTRKIAGGLSRVQTGFVYHYAFIMMLGLVGLVTWLFFVF